MVGDGSWVGSLDSSRSSCQNGCELQEIHASGSDVTEREQGTEFLNNMWPKWP